jgi:hypothetical protein
MWNLVLVHLEVVLVLVQDRCRFVLNIPEAQKSFWMHLIVLLGDEAQVDARFGSFDIVLILTQDRCVVCAECTKGLEIILDAPDGTPR